MSEKLAQLEKKGGSGGGMTAPYYSTSGGTIGEIPKNTAVTVGSGYMGSAVVGVNKMAKSLVLTVSNGGSYGVKLLRDANGAYSQETYTGGTVTITNPEEVLTIYAGSGATISCTIDY